jgi:hypothetical protein
MAAGESDPIERTRAALLRDTVRISGVITAVCCALLGFLAGLWLALSVALGALIMLANFLLLARALTRLIERALDPPRTAKSESDPADPDDPGATPHEPTPPPSKTPAGPLRLAVLVLAMTMILWYMPARPEGLAVGILIVLLAATIAGVRQNRAAQAG